MHRWKRKAQNVLNECPLLPRGKNEKGPPYEFIFHGFGYVFNTLIEFQCKFYKVCIIVTLDANGM